MAPEGAPKPPRSSEESLAARLKARFGEEVDPKVSLAGEDDEREQRSDFSSALVTRLSGRSGTFGRYELKYEIARGGMGAILKVWDEDLHRHLAMKVILGQGATEPDEPELALIESKKLARFLEEAQITGQLDHPGIVPVHELGLDADGRVYFTMKLVKGRSLKDVFDLVTSGEEGWTQTKALGVLLKVCEAMSYAHHKGVIHRDLKPANVMVGKFGEVHVMDWGLARILGRKDERDIRVRDEHTTISTAMLSDRDRHRGETPDSPLYTMAGDVVGTPAYMSPEQAGGKVDEVGPASDVYALGAMLYHLFAGHMPYVPPGARLTNYAIWGLVQQGPPTPIATIAPRVPTELVAICEKAMARDWKQRYRDMSELAEDLSAYLEHRVVSAYETGAWAETKKWIERNKPLAASLAAGVLALAAGLVVSLSLKRKADANAAAASANETRALAGETEAEQQREIASATLEQVLSLSAIQELTDLEAEADRLWPVDPARIPAYDAWLVRARALVDGRPADTTHGIERRFGLADHRASLAEIRRRAKPLTEEQRAADRQASANFTEWQSQRAESSWIARMLGETPWPDERDVEAQLAREELPVEVRALNALAWPLVDPDPRNAVYGSEMRALLLARRTVAADADARYGDTLAWALYRTGRLDDALTEERRALGEASGELKDVLVESSRNLQEAIASWRSDDGRARHAQRRQQLEQRAAEFAADVERRRTWEFEVARDAWWHAQLARLVDGIEDFQDPRTGLLSTGISPRHSWGVAKRREFAASIEERTVSGAAAKNAWAAAIDGIAASPKYRGLRIEPQLGLLPIGPDPQSGLWEFSHVSSGERFEAALRGVDGNIVLGEEVGVVLVLVPGETFTMGAQNVDPAGENYDPRAGVDESPPNEVTLAPFLLSKYELTQAQWQRLTGRNPSLYQVSNFEEQWNATGQPMILMHPVEQVSWEECMEILPRHGLTLPTEAQWEYACRANTASVYWCGDDEESLRGCANLSDAYGKSNGNEGWASWEDWLDDGQTVHARVGLYRANAFGLHDVHGNVWEWCRDYGSGYMEPVRPGDGERQAIDPITRVFRGGSYSTMAGLARCAVRSRDAPIRRGSGIGARPAAALKAR